MNNRLKVGIIGNGFGRYGLAPAFISEPRVELYAVCASREASARELASVCGVERSFHDWRRILEQPLDLLAIAAPPLVQQEIALVALERRVPLFLEKQVSLDEKGSAMLLSVAENNHVKTCVNFIFPYLKTWQMVPKYLSRVGEIRQVFVSWRMETYDNRLKTKASWKTNDLFGGGVLQHFLSHSFFYIEHFFGSISKLKATLAKSPDINNLGTTFASLEMSMSRGFLVQLTASSVAYQGVGHWIEIYGTEGSLLLRNQSGDPVLGFELFFAPRGGSYQSCGQESELSSANFADSRVEPTAFLIDQFVSDLQGKAYSSYPGLSDGHRVQHLIRSAYFANESQAFVNI